MLSRSFQGRFGNLYPSKDPWHVFRSAASSQTDRWMMNLRTLNISERQSSAAKKPDFFIVGAPRCGTSSMTHYLGEHPEIYMARKEMHVFGSDLRFGAWFYRRGSKA